ncbi:hypothetical protein K0U27_00900 [archaeon]|nr:hypothetical protein [archaeon]
MKTRTLIPIFLGATILVFVALFYVAANDQNPAFQSGFPRISQNDMYCWTQWYLKDTYIDEEKLMSSLRSTVAMFGPDFDIPDREVTVTQINEETIISVGGSWTKDKAHHEKLTSIIKDHVGDSKITRDGIVMCT